MNCKMADLRAAFEAAGFTDVRTVLTSGNVVFDARSTSEGALEQKATWERQLSLSSLQQDTPRRQTYVWSSSK